MKLNKFVPLEKMEEQSDGTLHVYGLVTAEQPDLDKEVCDYRPTWSAAARRTSTPSSATRRSSATSRSGGRSRRGGGRWRSSGACPRRRLLSRGSSPTHPPAPVRVIEITAQIRAKDEADRAERERARLAAVSWHRPEGVAQPKETVPTNYQISYADSLKRSHARFRQQAEKRFGIRRTRGGV